MPISGNFGAVFPIYTYTLKAGAFIIFLSIVLTVYALVNSYIFIRGLQAIPPGSAWRPWYIAGFWVIVSAFVAARILERTHPGPFTAVVTWIGSFWLAFLLYFLLTVVLLDITRGLNNLLHFLPVGLFTDYARTKAITLVITISIVTLLVAAGFINARIPKIRTLELAVHKRVPGMNSLNIVMASDIHLGTIIASRKADRLVTTINGLNPDIVLFAGDVVDEDLAPVIQNNLGASLLKIKARFGVYAITGNHEYIGGAEPAVRYLEEHGIKMLRDTAVTVGDLFWIVGREDRDRPRFSGKARKELSELMAPVDKSMPVIVMDHQPFNLGVAAGLGADLHLSGHTHHGQLWPFNYITSAIFEVSRGYKKIGNGHFYVSTGYGTWGPPVRIGNRPEIVNIRLRFDP